MQKTILSNVLCLGDSSHVKIKKHKQQRKSVSKFLKSLQQKAMVDFFNF